MASSESPLDIVQYIDATADGGEKCGYCKQPDTHYIAGGLWTHRFSPLSEQRLLEYGWRRSGKFMYVFDPNKNCCPLYMIKCNASEFIPSNSQKRVLRKVIKFIKVGKKEKNDSEVGKTLITKSADTNEASISINTTSGSTSNPDINTLQTDGATATPIQKPLTAIKNGIGADPNKPLCSKAKEIRRQNKLSKLQLSNNNATALTDPEGATPNLKPLPIIPNKETIPKSFDDYIKELEYREGYAHEYETKMILVNPESEQYKATEKESHQVYTKYQIKVHNDTESDVNLNQFKSFLVTSAVTPVDGGENEMLKYGCYHQQHYIDGKLFMVGVLDIMPNYISSVYLYYDPAYMFLSPGTFAALNEIELTRQLQARSGVQKWYCMGFYASNIQKMRYKGEFQPSYLNCLYSHNWISMAACKDKTDKYYKLDDVTPTSPEQYIDSTIIFQNGMIIPYSIFAFTGKSLSSENKQKLLDYSRLVGPQSCSEMACFFDSF